jgi:hypothetical protein
MNFLRQCRASDDHESATSAAAPRARGRSRPSRFESCYLTRALSLSPDAPGAHAVTLLVDGWLDREAVRARLIADPNVCDVNDFGDPSARARLAPRTYAVALTRLRADDPACAGRKLFAITGADLPEDLTLVMYPYGDRVYLKLRDELVPLHQTDGGCH